MTDQTEKYVLWQTAQEQLNLHVMKRGIPYFIERGLEPCRLPEDEARNLVARLNSIAPSGTLYYCQEPDLLTEESINKQVFVYARVLFPVFLTSYTYNAYLQKSEFGGNRISVGPGVTCAVAESIGRALVFDSRQEAEYTNSLIQRFREGNGFSISPYSSFAEKGESQ